MFYFFIHNIILKLLISSQETNKICIENRCTSQHEVKDSTNIYPYTYDLKPQYHSPHI